MPKAAAAADNLSKQELRNCTCSRLRRAGRQVTQLYDQALEPAGLTIGQFGLLAHLSTAATSTNGGIAIGTLAHARGMDPTTLTRNLKPLVAEGWVMDAPDPGDRRVRAVAITPSGRKKYRAAAPFWQSAEAQMETLLGPETLAALNALLEVSIGRVDHASRSAVR
jgi:DNA-binding MarR family transcriptional regulator